MCRDAIIVSSFLVLKLRVIERIPIKSQDPERSGHGIDAP